MEITKPHSKSFLVSTWYRPPQSDSELFNLFKQISDKIDAEDSEVYLLGDLNCNFLTKQNNSNFESSCRFMFDEFMFHRKVSNSGVIYLGISDHCLIFLTRKINHIRPGVYKTILARNLKNFNEEFFLRDLEQQEWNVSSHIRHGGGLFIYIRRELIVTRVNDLEGDKVESITLSMQTSRSTKKLLIIGAYRPPNLPKNIWVPELNNILLRASQRFDGLILIGDLNCDLSHPHKGTKDGQALIDLADVYYLTSLMKTPTRMTADSSSLIDVVLTNKPRSVITSGAFDFGLSDHHFVYTILWSDCPRSSPRTVI